MVKADNKRQAFINTDTRRVKIQAGNMEPPPPPPPPLSVPLLYLGLPNPSSLFLT